MTLTLTKIARFYGPRLIFKDVSLDLRPGSVTLLAGANGAGKTTLLKIMAGLIRPSAGEVARTSRHFGSSGEQEAAIGYLGHRTFLYPGLSALENLAFWASLHGRRHQNEDLLAALQRMELDAFAEEKAGGFSRGMLQRLSLARFFLLEPDLLLLDEPGTGLDARSQAMLRREITEAAARKAAVVWITHSPRENVALADRVAMLENRCLRLFESGREYLEALEKTGGPSRSLRNAAEGAASEKTENTTGGMGKRPDAAPMDRAGQETPSLSADAPEAATEIRPIAATSNQAAAKSGPSFFGAALAVARKDLELTVGRGSGLLQAMLLGLLLIFVFSLSLLPGQLMTPEAATAIFWMASAFCQVLIFSTLYAHEEGNLQRHGLILAPVPVQAVWLGKLLAGACLLLGAQLLFFPAAVVFLGQNMGELWLSGLCIALLADLGIVTLGSLLGALSQGQTARESLLSIVLFPLLAPLFLAGIRLGAAAFGAPEPEDAASWFGLASAFDAIFLAAALVLFPHVYTAEE